MRKLTAVAPIATPVCERSSLRAAPGSDGAQHGGLSHRLKLYVVDGHAFVPVGIGGINDEKAVVEKAKTLGRKILAKL